MDDATTSELRNLADLYMRTPWWEFWTRAALANAIVAKIRFRLPKMN